MSIYPWATRLLSLISDWRTAQQNRPEAKVSLSEQHSRVYQSPLPMGAAVMGTGLQHPLGAVDQGSRMSLADVRPKEHRPVLADQDGNILVSLADEAMRIF